MGYWSYCLDLLDNTCRTWKWDFPDMKWGAQVLSLNLMYTGKQTGEVDIEWGNFTVSAVACAQGKVLQRSGDKSFGLFSAHLQICIRHPTVKVAYVKTMTFRVHITTGFRGSIAGRLQSRREGSGDALHCKEETCWVRWSSFQQVC